MPSGYTSHAMMVSVIVVLAAIPLCVVVYAVYLGVKRGRVDWSNAGTLFLLLLLMGGALWAAIGVYRQDAPISVAAEETDARYSSAPDINECQFFAYLPDEDTENRYALLLATTKNLKTNYMNSSLSLIREPLTRDKNSISMNYERKFSIVFPENDMVEFRQLDNADGAETLVATSRVSAERLIFEVLRGQYMLTRYWGRGDHRIYSVNASVPADATRQFEACTIRLGGKFRN